MPTPLPALNSAFGHGSHDQVRPEVAFYFDIVCPYAYLASTQIEALAARTGAVVSWRPVLLGGMLRALGSDPGAAPAAKQALVQIDQQRWAEHLGVPLRRPADHPLRTVEAMRLLCWSPRLVTPQLAQALYRAYWVDGLDIRDVAVLADVAASVGLPREQALLGLQGPGPRLDLQRRTDDAIAAGVFGVPTFVVESHAGPKLFFGQDRMHFVEAALQVHPLQPGGLPERDPSRRPRTGLATATAAATATRTATTTATRTATATAAAATAAIEEALAHDPVANEARRITFYYDFSSPFSYLASTQIEDVAARHGAVVRWQPILLGGLFRQIGTPLVPINTYCEPKRRHAREDLLRWAHYYDVPFHWPSRFPMMTVTALRLSLLAGDKIAPLSHEIFRAYWAEDADLNDPQVLEQALVRVGLPVELLQQVGEAEVKAKLIESTEAAAVAGVFGAPSFRVEQHHGPPTLFFGQDRLLFVEKALQKG